MTDFNLQFELSEIAALADKYLAYASPSERIMEANIENDLVPKVRSAGYLDRDSFLKVCRWKSSRPRKYYEQNSADFIKEASTIAFSTSSEQIRIGVLTLLQGVQLPVSSAFLHWFHKDNYPVLDFRALESLGIRRAIQPKLDFNLWCAYTQYCRQLLAQAPAGTSMRTLDRALWQFSKPA
jgi:hypothetical protein